MSGQAATGSWPGPLRASWTACAAAVADGPYRILVTGSRDWDDYGLLSFELGTAITEAMLLHGDVTVVHGAARGADQMAASVAASFEVTAEPHPAEWGRYGKAAGPRRNAEMVDAGASLCLAFIKDGSRGATHCAGLAEKAGIETRRFTA